ncbi:MAG: cytochrome c biogenesis protein CcsA [Flavobacteriaceae bacterium]
MKKIFKILYSTRLMAFLFIVFAAAMGIATFIENDYGTQTAKALVYNTWWFEAIMIFFVINFFGNIFRYRLLRKEKWPVLMFHLAFLFILIGAGITRYIGYEGIMLINEGEATSQFLSETTYVNVIVDNSKEQKTYHKKTLLSGKGTNNWGLSDDFRGKDFSIKLTDYIQSAEEKFIEDENGIEYIFLVESSGGSRHEHYIKKGSFKNIHNILVGFETENNSATINIFRQEESLRILAKSNGDWLRMADQKTGLVTKDSIQHLQLRSLYNIDGLPFVIPDPIKKGELKTVRAEKFDKKKLDVLKLDITVDGTTKEIELVGGQYNVENSKEFSVNGLNFRMLYGSQILEAPFQIKLNDFQLEKYPGSESAASYASEVTVIDGSNIYDYRIFMNHILDHKGYKFFQSSYDLTGEVEQTHLSVNHDFWGMLITYIGYSFLYTGMICILFAKNTRFDYLKKTLNKIKKKKAALSLFAGILLSTSSFAQDGTSHVNNKITDQQIDSILKANIVDLAHAEKFNKLVIQDSGGRMKPAHTFASELVRKVSQQETFNEMEPSQVLISIIENSRFWFEVPFIYLEEENTKIRELIGVDKDVTHARLSDFITLQGDYKIREDVAEAQKENVKNKFQKDLIKIDRRVGLLYRAIAGGIFKIYPIPGDDNNTWVSHPETSRANFKGKDSLFVKQALPLYIDILQIAKKSGDYKEADKILNGLKRFQKKLGAKVYPSEKRINLEITYNKVVIFKRLAFYYGIVSVFLIFFVILQIFYYKTKWIQYLVKFLIAITIILFLMHIAGLVSRWYISGNAPWSNAYESLIYVAWSTMLFGLAFGRKSTLTVAATTFVTAIILAFAHQNWLDPEIANLVPVLNSWWLWVHVSIIVASYGPFTIGMILGILALILSIFKTKKNKKRIDLNIKEITAINEMAITIGLVMLTIGNFLGGMWANESWGRYWGWDPKETWALISIMIYAFVLHMRLIPGLRGKISFNFMSAFAYLSIMMTYFGVNFYLSGLHSYASGDKQVTPREAYIYIAFIVLITVFASIRNKVVNKN